MFGPDPGIGALLVDEVGKSVADHRPNGIDDGLVHGSSKNCVLACAERATILSR